MFHKWSKCCRSFSTDGASLLQASRASLGIEGANKPKHFTPNNINTANNDTQDNAPPLRPQSRGKDSIQSRFQPNISEFSPRFCVVGVGGGGGNAVDNMILRDLQGVDFLVCNTDAQHLARSQSENILQLGHQTAQGLGCGANPDAGRAAAVESLDEVMEILKQYHMVFITAGMGGGTGTGAAPVIAEACLDAGILTVAVVTKPFNFEGRLRTRLCDEGISNLERVTDTLIVVPNQNLFELTDPTTSMVDSFRLADDVLLAGVRSITDLMVIPGLINLDFADVQSVMKGMGSAMMGSGHADGEDRAVKAAELALRNPLLGNISVKSAKGMLVNITGGTDLSLHEVDKATQLITNEVEDEAANIIFGASVNDEMDGSIRVSIVATGIEDAMW